MLWMKVRRSMASIQLEFWTNGAVPAVMQSRGGITESVFKRDNLNGHYLAYDTWHKCLCDSTGS